MQQTNPLAMLGALLISDGGVVLTSGVVIAMSYVASEETSFSTLDHPPTKCWRDAVDV